MYVEVQPRSQALVHGNETSGGGLHVHCIGYRLLAHWGLLVDWLDDKLFVIEGDVADLTPGKPNLGGQLVVSLVDIEAKGVHTKPQLCSLLVLDAEEVDTIHLEILSNL